jgi:molybdopterin synthase catalytic subunit
VSIRYVGEEPLDLAQHLAAVASPAAGAVVTFIGQVRDHDPGVTGPVSSIEYSAHPDAEDILARLVSALPANVLVAVSHRTGRLAVGDLALVACVASAHRDAAYTASRDLIESIKHELPIWKRQLQADGTATWVGL